LVVIGIVAVLVALLLPALRKARRAAVVLASPVAYVASDNAVHLTDPSGGLDLRLTRQGTFACPVCHSPPTWSPAGTLLSVRGLLSVGSLSRSVPAVVDPMTGKERFFSAEVNSVLGWLDGERFLQSSGPGDLSVHHLESGSVRLPDSREFQYLYAAPAPPGSPGSHVGVIFDRVARVEQVGFMRKDMTRGRVVWTEPSSSSRNHVQSTPRVDPLAEFVGWTLKSGGRAWVATKGVREHASARPNLIGEQFVNSYFCDWTEQGDILANVRRTAGGAWKLVLLDRLTGGVKAELETGLAPMEGPVASWRKYEHR
jgi:hypothetical protein